MIPNVSKTIKFIPITVLLLASILVGTLTATHVFTSNRTSKIISTTTTRAEHTTKTMSSSTLETSVTTTTLPTTTVSSTSSLSNTTTTSIPPFPTSQSSIGCVSEQTLQVWYPGMNVTYNKIDYYPQSVDANFMQTTDMFACYLNKFLVNLTAGTMWQYGIYNGTPTQGIFIVLDFWNVPSSSNIFIPLPGADHEPNPLQIVSVNPQGDVLTLEPLTGALAYNSHPNPNINYYFSIPLGKFIS